MFGAIAAQAGEPIRPRSDRQGERFVEQLADGWPIAQQRRKRFQGAKLMACASRRRAVGRLAALGFEWVRSGSNITLPCVDDRTINALPRADPEGCE